MLVSMNWISDFVDLSGLDKEALIRRFTLSTAEVEDIYKKGYDTNNVVVARIASIENHPNSKKLHLLKIDVGEAELIDCVCGAPNVREGMKVAFARAGGSVCGNAINVATVAGYTSAGMCCSEYELGISADHSGLMEITEDCAPGTDIKKLYDIEDIVFEVDNKSLTNRPDLWGHYGIAREFSALADRPLKAPELVEGEAFAALPAVSVEIVAKELAYRYCSVKAENITVKTSPVNMRIRLFYCGLRAINLLADLTNYVMLELGQPMHAFDLKKVDNIQVKCFEQPIRFSTLDGEEREIDTNTLMICSGGKPVAVAGIMGGLESEITSDTDSLLLESANFDAVSVRKSSQRLGLRTDSSMRYEKTLDPELTMTAVGRFIKLLTLCDGGVKIISRYTDVYVKKYPKVVLEFDKRYVDRYTGISIDNERIMKTLHSLGFGAQFFDGKFTVTVPSWRATKDVTIKADIIEEITRIYGYDNFEIITTKSALKPIRPEAGRVCDRLAKDLLVDRYGLHEVHSYIWCDGKKYKKLGIEVEENVRILNIATPENGTLRNSLVPTLLAFVNENKSFAPDYGIFEIGRAVKGVKENGECDERKMLGIVLFGRESGEKQLFHRLLGIISELGSQLKHVTVSFENTAPTHGWQHPKNTALVKAGDRVIGYISAAHPTVAEKLDKNASAVFAELDMAQLSGIERRDAHYREPSRFPGIDVDLSFAVGSACYGELEQAWKDNTCEYLTDVKVIDVYEGAAKSITVRLSYASAERTLAREEIEPHITAIVQSLAAKGIKLK